MAGSPRRGATYVRQYEVASGSDTVSVELVPGRVPGGAWRLALSCNGRPMGPGGRTLAGGTRVAFTQSAGAAKQAGLVVVQAAGSRVAITQEWLAGPAPGLADYLSMDVAVQGPLPQPVTGTLARSYQAAAAAAQAQAQAKPAGALPAGAAPGASAPLNATDTFAASGMGA